MAQVAGKGSLLVASLMKQAKPKFATFMKYAVVELTPPSPTDIPAIRKGIANIIGAARKGTYKQLTVKQAWLNTLVTMEVFFWFYAGECIGKGRIVGYNV